MSYQGIPRNKKRPSNPSLELIEENSNDWEEEKEIPISQLPTWLTVGNRVEPMKMKTGRSEKKEF